MAARIEELSATQRAEALRQQAHREVQQTETAKQEAALAQLLAQQRKTHTQVRLNQRFQINAIQTLSKMSAALNTLRSMFIEDRTELDGEPYRRPFAQTLWRRLTQAGGDITQAGSDLTEDVYAATEARRQERLEEKGRKMLARADKLDNNEWFAEQKKAAEE